MNLLNRIFALLLCIINFSCSYNSLPDFNEANVRYSLESPNEEIFSDGFRNFNVYEEVNDESYDLSGSSPHRKFDLYKPERDYDGLPLVIFVHPGAFITGDKKDYTAVKLCKDLARRGYAAASINYKMIDIGINLSSNCYIGQSIMEAVVDLHVAVRYFVENSDRYNIDKRNIFIIGYSAGAIITNHFVFSSSDEMNNYLKEREQSSNIIQTALGLNNCAINDSELIISAQEQFVKGIVSMSGGMMSLNHVEDRENKIPLLLIHGDRDEVVPLGEGRPFLFMEKNINITIPGLVHELAISSQDGEALLKLSNQNTIHIPKYIPKILRQIFFSNMWGSESVKSLLPSDKCKMINVSDGPHNFVMTKDGRFNVTYYEVRYFISSFFESL